ncbi:MAG: HAD family hydrolase [Anaerolineae bacterium]
MTKLGDDRLPMFADARAFLFDFDGTLVHQRNDFDLMRRLTREVVSRYVDDMAPFSEMWVLEMIDVVRERLRPHDEALAARFAQEAAQAILEVELAAAESAAPFAGVPDMLAELHRRGRGVGIVTRNCRLVVAPILERFGMSCDVLVTRDDTCHVKPDPRHLLVALEALAVPGAEAVMCGDHPTDVAVGKEVGARTVGVYSPERGPEYFADVTPDLVLSNVADLLAYV